MRTRGRRRCAFTRKARFSFSDARRRKGKGCRGQKRQKRDGTPLAPRHGFRGKPSGHTSSRRQNGRPDGRKRDARDGRTPHQRRHENMPPQSSHLRLYAEVTFSPRRTQLYSGTHTASRGIASAPPFRHAFGGHAEGTTYHFQCILNSLPPPRKFTPLPALPTPSPSFLAALKPTRPRREQQRDSAGRRSRTRS